MQDSNRNLLCGIIEPFVRRIEAKMRKKVFWNIDSRNGKIAWIGFWIHSSCTILSRALVWLLPVPGLKTMTRWEKKFSSNQDIITIWQNVFFRCFGIWKIARPRVKETMLKNQIDFFQKDSVLYLLSLPDFWTIFDAIHLKELKKTNRNM